jgi:two-component system, cell cycle sensor histidine kinase and response regulator CckA
MNTEYYLHNPKAPPALRPKSAKRRQAEKKIRMVEELQSDLLDPKTVRQLVSDLRAYQIELEIQNEELRGLQQELEVSKSRFKELYDLAPAGYVTVSEQGVIVEGNRTAAHLLNVAAETLVGQTFFRFILAEDQDIYYQHRAAIFETAEPQSCKLRLLRPDLRPFWVRLLTAPVGGETDQRPAMCLIMFNDIDDGIRLAEEKNQLEAKCRNLEKAESLGRMAGAIAHHFNNLLGVVMGNLELAEDAIAQKTDSFRYITSSMQAARRAAEVSGSLLTYLGQSFAQQQPLDFAKTCQSGIGKLQSSIPKEIEIVADFPSDGPLVNANAYQIHQVLKNLLTNAWESQNRGTIHLSMQTITPVDIPAARRFPLDSQFEHRLYACLAVRDTGCGIAAPAIEQIFDPFYTSSFLGRGLGLPIALGIVRAHGGFITVTSKVGKGSVFSIFLPVYEEEITLSTGRTIIGQEKSEGKTELIFKDEPMFSS